METKGTEQRLAERPGGMMQTEAYFRMSRGRYGPPWLTRWLHAIDV